MSCILTSVRKYVDVFSLNETGRFALTEKHD